jgi:SSS family solute:Na+ symporter
VLIVLGCALIIPFGLEAAGGWDSVMAAVPPEKMHPVSGIGWKTIMGLIVMYFTSFAVGQEVVQRYYAARDEKAARTGSFIAAIFYVFFACIPAFIGILAFAMVQNGTLDPTLIEANGTRYVLPTMAAQVLPPVMVALLFAALISATMSSADSDLLAAGSLFANDIYRAHLKPHATDAEVLRMTRLTMIAVGVLSLGVALLDIQDLIGMLMFSFALRAGGAFIPYVVGHYWKKASAIASASAITTGSATVILAKFEVLPTLEFDPSLLGVSVSALTFVIATHLFPRDATGAPA